MITKPTYLASAHKMKPCKHHSFDNSLIEASSRGFSLIELIVAIAIIGILVSIATPSYQQFILQERRMDARHMLFANDNRLSKCLTLAGSYENNCRLITTSKSGHYTLDSQITAQTWTINAVPVVDGPQSSDKDCHTLTLNHIGVRGATGALAENCW